jgi:transcriptional regulator with GAF, ATPase, and Fis domain
VAATNRNLRQRVAQRQFREDLFFRLAVFPIQIPPLRERTDDVLLLARHFCDKFGREAAKGPVRLAPDAIDALQGYAWPGNVRELQNCIERAVIMCEEGDIHARHLQLSVRPAPVAPAADPWDQIDLTGSLPEALRRITGEVERRKIAEAVAESGGDIARAADILHVSYKALVQRLRTA